VRLRDFYRIAPSDWLFLDHQYVIAARKRAEANPNSREETIEEYVRQWVLRELIDTYDYPIEWLGERIVIEEPVRIGSTEKQADVSVKNSGHKTYLYIEVKNLGISEVAFDEARKQLESYLAATHTATIGMVTDGKRIQILEKKVDPNDFNYIPDIPSYNRDKIRYKNVLVREIRTDISQKRKTGLKPLADNLDSILFDCHSLIRDIDGLHDDEALDELCKIIFTKIFDERDICRKPEGTAFKFQIYGASNTEEIASLIRDRYEEAKNYDLTSNSQNIIGYERSRGVFRNPIRLSSNAIAKIVEKLQGYSFIDTESGDLKGRAFQKVLGAAIRAGMGQYFTPDEVVQVIVEIVDPTPQDLILDPFCGSGHFLSSCIQYVEKNYGSSLDEYSKYDFRFNRLHGIEKSDRMVRIAMTDMMLHDDGHTNIRNTDALLSFDNYPDIVGLGGERNETPAVFSKILTNPPFGSIMQGEIGEILGRFQLGHRKKSLPLEYIGLERCLQFLRPNGILAIVLPDGIITNRSAQFARSWVMSQAKLRAIISLPTETFGPFGTMTKTSILIIQKLDKNERISFDYPVFMANIEDIGYDATGRRTEGKDVREILFAWQRFKQNHNQPLDVPRKRAYITTGDKLQFRWDFKAGLLENNEQSFVPMSKYIDIIKDAKNLEKRKNETFPYLSISELPENPFILDTPNNVPAIRLFGPKYKAKGGDILFARLGPSMANRKSLMVDKSITELYCSNEFHVLRPKAGIDSEFVLYLVKSDSFIIQAQSKARGATPSRLRVYEEDLLNIHVPEHSAEEMKSKGSAYLIGRRRAIALITEAESIINEVSPDF
jgi:type I restriction enzyme M protein